MCMTIMYGPFLMKFEFLNKFSKKNTPISNFTKIHPLGAVHAGGRTDRHDEANNRFCNFENTTKNINLIANIVITS